jgi:hypothetical protein
MGGKRRPQAYAGPDKDYGAVADQEDADEPAPLRPPSPDPQLGSKMKEFLDELYALTVEMRQNITKDTIRQSADSTWFEERRKRLTASLAGEVCRRIPHNSAKNLVVRILYKGSSGKTQDMKDGNNFEETARSMLSHVLKVPIQRTGLHVDAEHPFLAASPGKYQRLLS